MTVQELSRYLTLRKQIDEDKEIYENMCQKMGPASPSLSGMPHTPGVRDKVGDLAAHWPQPWQTRKPASKSLKPKPKGYFQQ